ncbi:flagellar hook formation protein FlgD [Salmonella sp. NCTC 11881]|nr:flagellar hook formation protein FlgD [Salmonella sp. NCTC 11881]
MSIAVNMNDPTNTGVKTTTGSGSMTGSNAADLQSSFPDLTGRAIEEPGPD